MMKNERKMEKAGWKSARRKKIVSMCIGMVFTEAIAVGCGSTGETVDEPEVIRVESSKEAGTDNNAEPDSLPEESRKNTAEQINDDTQSNKLMGTIKSIEENSVVISRAFEEAPDELVQPADGSLEEVLLTVSVSETTVYEITTVKNGGVNGDADVERSEGSFSDMKEGANADFFGSFEGDGFRADKVIIYRFV